MNRHLGMRILQGHYDLTMSNINKAVTARQLAKIMRVTMPYTTVTLKNGDELLLNRDYSPLGMPPNSQFDYECFSLMAIPAEAVNKKAGCSIVNNEMYLFNDSCPPWRGKQELIAYMARVQEVFKL